MIGRASPIMEFEVPPRSRNRRKWLSGVAITISTIVAYLAFWHLAPGTTFIVGCLALVGVVAAGWIHGTGPEEPTPPRGK